MKLIVGLGNPGEKYESTRHNLGFMVLEQFLKDSEPVEKTAWQNETKLKSDIFLLEWQPKKGTAEKAILAKPKTYMNNSGMAVSLLASFYKIDPSNIWIVYDELDLPIGHMKIRFGGAAAGHHGVESIIEQLGTDKFWRFRLGIGEPRHSSRLMRENGGEAVTISRRYIHNAEDFVLHTFTSQERSHLKKLIKSGSDALQTALEKGIEKAQTRFNTK